MSQPEKPESIVLEVDDRRWKEHEEDWTNGVLINAPESWGGEEAAEFIALSYVATLEARMDAAGLSREKWVEDPAPQALFGRDAHGDGEVGQVNEVDGCTWPLVQCKGHTR